MCKAAREAGAYGAKVTGAGGGTNPAYIVGHGSQEKVQLQ